jgi:hypothetical protein
MIDEADRDLKDALGALRDGSVPALDTDLWPRMRARLDAPRPGPSALEWALAAAIGAAALMFPQIMLGVLYHL